MSEVRRPLPRPRTPRSHSGTSPADTNVLRYIQLTQLKMNRCSLPRQDSDSGAGGPARSDVMG